MVRTNPHRRRGRPFGRTPVFLADCVRLDATELLARSRGARLDDAQTHATQLLREWTLQWTEHCQSQWRRVALAVTTTQHLGGVRRWWRCPLCGRRCRVLLVLTPQPPIGCRLCLQARYVSDYPARDRRRRFVALVNALGTGGIDEDAERDLDVLLARRRRGVRRGRRILLRAACALGRLHARYDALPDILNDGGL